MFRSIAPVALILAAVGHVEAIRFLGRVNPATRQLTWPSTGVSFTFTGTSASIGISQITGANSADLYIDGGDPIVVSSVSGTSINTPAGLANGTHTVELRKRSEYVYGTFTLGEITTDGTFGADKTPSRLIEIIGDSISVGYGLDGTLPCTDSAALQDNPATYGALAANSLSADYSAVAWSGKGLIRNYVTPEPDTTAIVPELWTRYGAGDADGSYTFPADRIPDAVVIGLGTNDFGYLSYYPNGTQYPARPVIDASVFTAAAVDFVQTIQTHYPDAYFFFLTSPMLSNSYPTAQDAQKTTQTNAFKAAIEQLGSSKVTLVEWPSQGSDVGCDYHPNAATHAAEAPVLAAAIKSALGW